MSELDQIGAAMAANESDPEMAQQMRDDPGAFIHWPFAAEPADEDEA